jgi:hypothetical protein
MLSDFLKKVFLLVLPSFSNLFTHVETRVGSISLFPKLAHRLGPDRTRQHLLKRIISMFEALRPNLPRVLFDHHMISEFIKRLGISTFLQQMLPCYLEALTIQSDDNSAGEALIHICHVLGAILTSKHIIRQLVKIMLRENGNESALLKTTVKIVSMFGVTFTSVQYAYLISLIGDLKKRKKKSDTKSLVCIMTLLEELMEHMSNENMVTELKSGFIGIIYQLLENNEEEQRIARLTMSIKTIEYLLKLSKFLTLQEWEATVSVVMKCQANGYCQLISFTLYRLYLHFKNTFRVSRVPF